MYSGTRRIKTLLKPLAVIAVAFMLSACGEGLDEAYTGVGGTQEFRFSSDGTLVQSVLGNKVQELKYEKDGNEIKVYLNEKTTQIWTLQENGDISVPPGLTLTVKK
jgi:hypothetical protein